MAKMKVTPVDIDDELDFITPIDRRRGSRRGAQRRRAQLDVSTDTRQGERRRHRRRREDREQAFLGPAWQDLED
jgi:hypothetical protein